MDIKQKYMTRNDCYKAGHSLDIKGIMVHCTATPGIMASQWFSRWNKSFQAGEIARQVCVHSFVDDKEVWQYLPWTMRSWHAGTGWGGDNDTHISIEMCEPAGHTVSGGKVYNYDVAKNKQYFQDAYNNTIDLCVYLCKEYDLTEKDIIDHWEGGQRGTASRSSDVVHWFSLHNKTMNDFRADVKIKLKEGNMYFSSTHNRSHELVKPVQEFLIWYYLPNESIQGGAQGTVGGTTSSTIKRFKAESGLPNDDVVDFQTLVTMLTAAKDKPGASASELAHVKGLLENLQSRFDIQAEKLSQKSKDLIAAGSKALVFEGKYEESKDENVTLVSKLEEKRDRITDIKKQLAESNGERAMLKNENGVLKTYISDLKSTIDGMVLDLKDLMADKKELEQEIVSLKKQAPIDWQNSSTADLLKEVINRIFK